MIKLNNFSFFYKDGNGINISNLNFEKGKAYGLIGPNGSGKTTLIKSIEGNYLGNGYLSVNNTSKYDEFLKNMSVCRTTDYSIFNRKFYHRSTVLKLVRRESKINEKFNKDYAAKLLEEFNIDIFSVIKNLSKGNQLIVYIICALSREVDFYVFDEPFATIDQIYRRRILELMMETVSDNKTVIVSSHDLDNINTSFDEYIFLKNGEVKEVIKQENLETLKDKYYDLFEEGDYDD